MSDRLTPPPLTLAGFRRGMALTAPLTPGIVVFALAFGTVAAQKGLSFGETMASSAFVYAGLAQFVSLEVWGPSFSASALLTLAILTFTVNLRLLLMSASLRPWMGRMPAARIYPSLFLTTDATWIIAMRYRGEGGDDVGVFLGSGVLLWFVWVAATAPGYWLGAVVPDPKRFALDLVMPVFFVVMLVPLWRGPRQALPWIFAGAVALTTHLLLGGHWHLVAGAVAGMLAAAVLPAKSAEAAP
jgi:predicted branched-subunit amino acid permease